jgi:asparagine synthase (glutamine-hydrolysing)
VRAPEHGAGLGHVRLSIIDLSPAGAQPMSSDDGCLVLSYNGEIYNFAELRSELAAAGAHFRGRSDTEVLLRLLEGDGLNGLPRLNGIFAFALLDRARGELTLVRDSMGVKPLYLLEEEDRVLFASEIKALAAMGGDLGDYDADALARYLTFLWCPGRRTPATRVSKVEPGEAITIGQGRIIKRWRWAARTSSAPRADGSALELIAETREQLRSAVHRQMVADVPLGAFLSGGLDSSAIVALARERNPELQCFSIEMSGGEEPGSQEDLPFARRVAAHLDLDLEVISVAPSELVDALPHMVRQLDEPLADPAPLNVLFISRLARSRGIKVLLSGAGGDDVFTGYRRHRAVELERLWSWTPAVFRRKLVDASSGIDQRRTWSRRLVRALTAMRYEGASRLASYFFWTPPELAIGLLSQDVRAHLSEAPEQPLIDYLADLPPSAGPLDRMLALEQRHFLGDHNLLYTDKMSMAAGVEVRVPFLDQQLLDFAARIPPNLKQRHGTGKWILKKAMEPLLPRDVIYRAKTGFGLPLRRWLRSDLRQFVDDTLSEKRIRERGLFDADAVQSLVSADRDGRIDATYTIFALLCIEQWMREFFDKRLVGIVSREVESRQEHRQTALH